MNRRTSQNQRKVRLQNLIRRRPAKQKEMPQPTKEEDASCQTQGCGCGN